MGHSGNGGMYSLSTLLGGCPWADGVPKEATAAPQQQPRPSGRQILLLRSWGLVERAERLRHALWGQAR